MIKFKDEKLAWSKPVVVEVVPTPVLMASVNAGSVKAPSVNGKRSDRHTPGYMAAYMRKRRAAGKK